MKIPNPFKGKINAQKAFDTATGMLDNLNFTNEERAELNKNLADKTVEFYSLTVGENTARSKTRRVVAVSVVVNAIVTTWFMLACHMLGYDIEPMLEIIAVFQMGWAFVAVIAFFFGGYYLNTIKTKQEVKAQKK